MSPGEDQDIDEESSGKLNSGSDSDVSKVYKMYDFIWSNNNKSD